MRGPISLARCGLVIVRVEAGAAVLPTSMDLAADHLEVCLSGWWRGVAKLIPMRRLGSCNRCQPADVRAAGAESVTNLTHK